VVTRVQDGQAALDSEAGSQPPIQRGPHAIPRLELPTAWLADYEGVVADRVDRLLADRQLLEALAASRFAGPGWDQFSDALARYGIQVIRAWIATGKIFAYCRERGYRTERQTRLHQDAIEAVAATTVAVAIAAFRDSVLPRGLWDPSRGASLRTYFIGQCLMRFPREYERWLKDNKPLELASDLTDVRDRSSIANPAGVAEAHALLDALVMSGAVNEKLLSVLALIELGFSQAEAADRLGTSISAIESILYRHRQKAGA
jgi:hypothetical protein